MMRYEKYKPSGEAWIGEIPTHWVVNRLKWNASFEYGESLAAGDRNDGSIPVFGSNGIAGFHDTSITKSPCIIIGRKGSFGKVNWSDVICFPIDTTYFIDESKTQHDLRWLFYLLPNLGLDLFSRDTGVPGLNRDDAYQNKVPIPPPKEQTAIANFLDERTTKIDMLITNKQKIIELLKEERTAIINQAVTRGIDPNVKFKPSGIDWLGIIPAHWEIKRISYISKIVRGGSPRPAGDPQYFNGTHTPWITVAEITKDENKYLSEVTEYLTEDGRKQSRFIDAGVLLLSNSGATLGVPKILKIGGCINDGSVAFLNLSDEVEIEFLYYFLKSLTELYRDQMKGYGQPNLNTDIVKATQMCFPEKEEQKKIIEYIDDKTDQIEKATDKLIQDIDLLQEYRTALISEVVTGKIKVT